VEYLKATQLFPRPYPRITSHVYNIYETIPPLDTTWYTIWAKVIVIVATYRRVVTVGTPLKTQPFKALKFTILINGKSARALADTGTIGGTLISNRFVTRNNIPYIAKKKPVVLKMAVKGSRSTSNYGCNVEIQI